MPTWTAYPPDQYSKTVWAYFPPRDFADAVFIAHSRRKGLGITDAPKVPRLYFPQATTVADAQSFLNGVRSELERWRAAELQRIADFLARTLTDADKKCVRLTYRKLDVQIDSPLRDEITRKIEEEQRKLLQRDLQAALKRWKEQAAASGNDDEVREIEIDLD